VTHQLAYTQDDLEKLRLNMQEFGFGVLTDPIIPSALSALQDEARELFESAQFAAQSAELNYRARIASLGPEGKRLLFGQQTVGLLSSVLGERVLPTETRSCLTFYSEGDHLGPHLDQPAAECRVTGIVYLAAFSPFPHSPNTGLVLRIYGREMTSDRQPRLTIPTKIGAFVIGWGSKVWHERPALEKDEYVVALTGCYRSLLT
jgi:hypothetical protein